MTRWKPFSSFTVRSSFPACHCSSQRAVSVRHKLFSVQAQAQSDWKDVSPSHLRRPSQDNPFPSVSSTDSTNLPHKADNMYNSKRTGRVIACESGIVTVEGGLPQCRPNCLVTFETGAQGLVLRIDNENEFTIGLINDSKCNKTPVVGTQVNYFENNHLEPPKVQVGPSMIGQVVDPMCNRMEWIEKVRPSARKRNEKMNAKQANAYENENAININNNTADSEEYPEFLVNMFANKTFMPHWMSYSRSRHRILTGIKSIDTFYPIGRGWRTAIVGDKNLRRSDIAIDVLLSFKNSNSRLHLKDRTYGIYVMIGKSEQEILELYDTLEQSGALEYSTIVASRNDDSLTKQYLTPYTGAAMADFFKYYSMNSIIIYDDFSAHNLVASTLFQKSLGVLNYGNWSAELLERACQIAPKYGGGSHTALALADKIDLAKDNGDTFYYYLPYLQSHVDTVIDLSHESFERKLIPPISLLPVPYGSPKFHKGFLFELSSCVRRKLFEMEELERTFRQQMELGLDLEPDIEKISSNVFKMEVMFNQRYETSFAQLLLCLSAISNGVCENIHLDWIFEFEARLLEYFENPNMLVEGEDNVKKQKIAKIEHTWKTLQAMKQYDDASDELKQDLKECLTLFHADNRFLFGPKPRR